MPQPFVIAVNRSTGRWGAPLAALLLWAGCRPEPGKPAEAAPSSIREGAEPRHARGFSLQTREGCTVVRVRRPWQGARADFTYRLRGEGAAAQGECASAAAIAVPAKRVLTMTTTNLPHLERLGVLGALVGMGGAKYACNAAVRAALAAGKIREVGPDMQLDLEAALGLAPDLVFSFFVGGSPSDANRRMENAGLRVVLDGAYMEETPLARAEWIKFTAAFFGRARQADSLFAGVDSAYQALASKARGVAHRPTVFVNAPIGGIWSMPSGRTYVARFLADAGADYVWKDDTTRGVLSLDEEAVMARAAEAEFWLNPGLPADGSPYGNPKLDRFRAVREGRIYANDAAACGGGNDFFETGASRPDLLLEDLLAIFHPELAPGHALRWYRRLERP